MQAPLRALAVTAAAGAGAAVYAGVVERNWFTLRRYEVPVLAPGAAPLRVLHLSDVHLTPGRHRLMSWIRSLDTLDPDLIVNTGDSISRQSLCCGVGLDCQSLRISMVDWHERQRQKQHYANEIRCLP